MRKPFSSELYLANNALGCAAGYRFLAEWAADEIRPNPDRYGVDLLFDKKGLLEVEIKHSWKGGKFPFGEINIPERKGRFFQEGAYFLLLSGNLQDYLILSPETILECSLQESPNKFMPSGELFFKVPKEYASFRRFSTTVSVADVFCCATPHLQLLPSQNKMYICSECGELANEASESTSTVVPG